MKMIKREIQARKKMDCDNPNNSDRLNSSESVERSTLKKVREKQVSLVLGNS